MAVKLVFDAEGCYQAFLDYMVSKMDEIMRGFYQEATSLLSTEGKAASELLPTEIKKGDFTSPGQAEAYIIGKMKFYADAIVESYGTGSLSASGSQSYWDEYVNNNPNFNQSRVGRFITGRPKGWYTNIWGEEKYSKGTLEGKIIEFDNVPESNIKPIKANYSIQNAEKWRIKDGETRTDKMLFEAADYFFSHYARDFFKEVAI